MKRYAVVEGTKDHTPGTVLSTHSVYANAVYNANRMGGRVLPLAFCTDSEKAHKGAYWNGSRFFGKNERVH